MRENNPARLRARMETLIGLLDDEAFAWIALALQSKAMTRGGATQIFPDGLGGFRDRERIEQLRAAAVDYIESAADAGLSSKQRARQRK